MAVVAAELGFFVIDLMSLVFLHYIINWHKLLSKATYGAFKVNILSVCMCVPMNHDFCAANTMLHIYIERCLDMRYGNKMSFDL